MTGQATPRYTNPRLYTLRDGTVVHLVDPAARAIARLIEPALLAIFGSAAAVSYLWDALASSLCFFGCANAYEKAHSEVQPVSAAVAVLAFLLTVPHELAIASGRGQTWGKKRMHLRVVMHSDGSTPNSLRVAFIRGAVPLAAAFVGIAVGAVIGFRHPGAFGLTLWVATYASVMWDRNGRGWHDKASGTVVTAYTQAAQRRDQQEQDAREAEVRRRMAEASDGATSPRTARQEWGLVSEYEA